MFVQFYYFLNGMLIALLLLRSVSAKFNIVADEFREISPQVIGHAGSSGYLPESTVEGYDMAARLWADYSEPDLVLTSDSFFIAMHDLTLEGTTNVADYPEYADRVDTFIIEGEAKSGYYALNFTLSEIRGLRVRQRFDGRSKMFDWYFSPPTLQDIIAWQLDYFGETRRLVGIYPELKHPDFYNSMGFPMEDLLLDQLADAGYHINDAATPRNLSNVVPVAIQCFKNSSLKYLSARTTIPLVQLMGISNEQPDKSAVYTESVLDEVATYAQAVGPDKALFTEDWGVSVPQAMRMRQWAADRSLLFVPWSFQREQQYIPSQFNGSTEQEMLYYYACLQSTAIFHEFPDMARDVADRCRQEMSTSRSGNCLQLCSYVTGRKMEQELEQ